MRLIQRHLLVYRLTLVGLTSLGLHLYSDVFTIIPLMLVPAVPGALFSPWREKYKNNSRVRAAIDWYDGVVWIWRGFPAKDDSPHWALKPRMGLGGMSFGMDRDTVNALAVYGPATSFRDSKSLPDDDAASFLKDIGFQDSDIEGALAKEATLAQPDVLTETRAGLVLAYDNAGLFEILGDVKADGLNYDGRYIFREPPMEVIKHLATSLGERPIIFENEVVFASNLIFLFEFVTVMNDGRSYKEGNSSERSIIWRAKPRYMGEDLSKYRLMDL
ncbi:hypothetical protein A6U89_22890 [Agrobacterium sp. B133/95]|uniref:hypothetical protein n=1 Tax=Rhizobium TaxID=379 RepID=UPI00026ECBB9|nr:MULTISPECIES: hypothetical protein [Rhizobium]EJK87316.1 hypothetical protein PMI03_01327 [Rhizobium sp. AP16]MDJ1632191.1 hypothetical protein [Rhizobium rhizogenes]OCJ14944.1 hypothetical protein A6U89_22890 [Agrobacterium sp. B133/95]